MSTTAPHMKPYLRVISQEAPSCTLLTKEEGKVEVQAHLLATISPFLASLLAQAGPSPVLSLPFSENLVRGLFASLVQNEPLGYETLEIAMMLGIQGSAKITVANQENRETKPTIEENLTDFQELEIKDVLRKNPNSLQFQSVSVKEEVEPVNLLQISINDPFAKPVEEKRTLKDHKRAHQEESEQHICNLCGKRYSNKANLVRHINIHKKHEIEKIACDQCPKMCKNKKRLSEHVKTHAPKPKRTREKVKSFCNICSKWLTSRDRLREHNKWVHGENEKLPCSNCGKNFKVSCVKNHEKLCKLSDEEKAAIKVECDQCGKILANKGKLKRHIRFIHNNEKLFKCKLCDHEDYRDDNMRTHIKNNHQKEDPKDLFSFIGSDLERRVVTLNKS